MPRGVLLDPDPATGRTRMIAADTGNHRLLVWADLPDAEGAAAAVVIGQPDGTSLYWPFRVLRHDGWLRVADTGNRRVLGWHGLPDGVPGAHARAGEGGVRPADVVLGQPDLDRAGENRWTAVAPDTVPLTRA